MITWPTLESNIADWLSDLGEKELSDTANFFATSYVDAITNGAEPMMNMIIESKGPTGLESAWNQALEAQYNSDSKIGPSNWMAVGGQIVMIFTGTMFQFSIPHPPTITGVSNLVTFPGTPGTIASGIDKAFDQEDPRAVAAELVSTYKNHASSIQGMFTGLLPPPASTPTPVPWAGIK